MVGSGRAGTTLLRAMLDSHPVLAIPPENYLITELEPRREAYEGDEGLAIDAFLADLVAHTWFERFELTGEDVRRELEDGPAAGFGDGIRALYAAYARSRGKPRYADKTPAYIERMEAIAEIFEESRFIHLIRDGRDVACSFLAQEDMRPNGPVEAALLWRDRVEAGRSTGARLGAERYLEARYEDLVADPERELARICDFIELEYDPAMLSYRERAAELTRHDGGAERHRGVFMAPTSGLRRWQDELSPQQVEAFELVAGELLEALSYPQATDASPPPAESAAGVLVAEVDRLRREIVELERTLRGRLRRVRSQRNAERTRRRRLEREQRGAGPIPPAEPAGPEAPAARRRQRAERASRITERARRLLRLDPRR